MNNFASETYRISSALDQVNTAHLISMIKKKLEDEVLDRFESGEDNVPSFNINTPYAQIISSGMIASFKVTKRGDVVFYASDGKIVPSKNSTRYRSRRTLRKWAKSKVGLMIADVLLKPLMPVEFISLNIKLDTK